jgi:hypothetical protein
MSTITGRVLAALATAERVPIAGASPPEEPGWYALDLDGQEPAVFAAECDDLAARLAWHRGRLLEGGAIALHRVCVRWVRARPVLGQRAWDRRTRRAVETVLLATVRPLWDADMVAAVRPVPAAPRTHGRGTA